MAPKEAFESWMSNVIRALEQTDFVTHLWVCSLFFASSRVLTNVTTLSFHPWADLMKDQPLLEQRSLFSCKASSDLHVTVQTLFTAEHPRKGPASSGPDGGVVENFYFLPLLE